MWLRVSCHEMRQGAYKNITLEKTQATACHNLQKATQTRKKPIRVYSFRLPLQKSVLVWTISLKLTGSTLPAVVHDRSALRDVAGRARIFAAVDMAVARIAARHCQLAALDLGAISRFDMTGTGGALRFGRRHGATIVNVTQAGVGRMNDFRRASAGGRADFGRGAGHSGSECNARQRRGEKHLFHLRTPCCYGRRHAPDISCHSRWQHLHLYHQYPPICKTYTRPIDADTNRQQRHNTNPLQVDATQNYSTDDSFLRSRNTINTNKTIDTKYKVNKSTTVTSYQNTTYSVAVATGMDKNLIKRRVLPITITVAIQ